MTIRTIEDREIEARGSYKGKGIGSKVVRSWRSSRLPVSLGCYQSSLPHNATAWTQAIWAALTLAGTTPYILVSVWSLASAALAFFMPWFERQMGVHPDTQPLRCFFVEFWRFSSCMGHMVDSHQHPLIFPQLPWHGKNGGVRR
jgi:hypothetical protein